VYARQGRESDKLVIFNHAHVPRRLPRARRKELFWIENATRRFKDGYNTPEGAP
jgi:hypothetical protein